MKRALAILLALTTLLVALSACQKQPEVLTEPEQPATGTEQPVTDPAEETEIHTPASPDAIAGDVNVVRNTVGKNYTAGDGTVILTATVSVPRIEDADYAAAAAIINDYYQTRQDNHLLYAEQELFAYADYAYTNGSLHGEDFAAHSTERYFDVEYNANGYLSILTTVVESAGADYEELSVVAETFEMSGGGLVTGAYLYNCDAATADRRIQELIVAQIDARVAAGETEFYDNYDALVADAYQADRFFLGEEGITYYFQIYELGHDTLGVPEFLISYEEVADIFKLW